MTIMKLTVVCQHVPKYLLHASKPVVLTKEAAEPHHSDTSDLSVSKSCDSAASLSHGSNSPFVLLCSTQSVILCRRHKDKKKKEAYNMSLCHQEDEMPEDLAGSADFGCSYQNRPKDGSIVSPAPSISVRQNWSATMVLPVIDCFLKTCFYLLFLHLHAG